jgi:hypothetical protein
MRGGLGDARTPLPAALDCPGIGRLLCRDGQRRAVSSMKECPRGFAQIRKDVWEGTGDHRGDAEAEQQGDNAEKHSEENVGRGPHGFREHTKASPMSILRTSRAGGRLRSY